MGDLIDRMYPLLKQLNNTEVEQGLLKIAQHAERIEEKLKAKDKTIEQQAARIEELEAERETWDGHKVCKLLRSDLADAADRIEQLEDNAVVDEANYMAALGRIEQLEAQLKATEDNEQVLVDASKPLLKRIAELEGVLADFPVVASDRAALIRRIKEWLPSRRAALEGEE